MVGSVKSLIPWRSRGPEQNPPREKRSKRERKENESPSHNGHEKLASIEIGTAHCKRNDIGEDDEEVEVDELPSDDTRRSTCFSERLLKLVKDVTRVLAAFTDTFAHTLANSPRVVAAAVC
jgi:hypothetical protein